MSESGEIIGILGKGDFFAYLPTLGNDFIASRGGNPLVVGGKIVGAIGVSGDRLTGRRRLNGRRCGTEIAFGSVLKWKPPGQSPAVFIALVTRTT